MKTHNEPFFKQNFIFGCLIGGTFIFASLLFILAGKGVVVNAQFHNIIMMLTIFGIFMGVRKYRDEQLAGVISYGKALKTGIYILCIASLCYAVYVFFLYTFNADLLTEFKNVTITTLKITGQNSPLFKMLEENMDVYFVPASIAFGELFNRILVGAAFSLFIAGLVRRSKLPFNPQEF